MKGKLTFIILGEKHVPPKSTFSLDFTICGIILTELPILCQDSKIWMFWLYCSFKWNLGEGEGGKGKGGMFKVHILKERKVATNSCNWIENRVMSVPFFFFWGLGTPCLLYLSTVVSNNLRSKSQTTENIVRSRNCLLKTLSLQCLQRKCENKRFWDLWLHSLPFYCFSRGKVVVVVKQHYSN